MTLEECYVKLGGSYADVKMRLPSQGMIERFLGKFLADGSFEELCRAMDAGNREEAFRAAHTLKGVCANLGFTRLMTSASQLTEALRPAQDQIPADAPGLLDTVRGDYQTTVDAIQEYRSQS